VKEEMPHFPETIVFDGANGPGHGPDGFTGRARIPDGLLDLVVEAAEECPGECIFVEV
jgi:ferredoxin